MPGHRCVVQDCGNIKNDELGISIHNSPASGSVRLKWKSFVSMHWKNFNLVGKFAVLGAFHKGLFYACISNERYEKEFEEGDVSNHLEKIFCNTIKAESMIGEWNYIFNFLIYL